MRTALLLCFALFCKQIIAQDKAFTGFYITLKGDTINGSFPKYNQSAKNPEKIQFSPGGGSTTIELNPLNCLKASINSYDEYIPYSGERLINPVDDMVAVNNQGYFSSRDSTVRVITFLRLVVQTPGCSVYVLNDNIRQNFFYRLSGELLQELRFKKYFVENNMHEVADYRQQLNNVFGGEITKKHMYRQLEELPYSENGFSEFILKLFSASKANARTSDLMSGWVINAGVSANSLNVKSDPSITEAPLDYQTSYTPYVSVGYFIPIQRNFNRYFLFPQVRLLNYKNMGEKISGSFDVRVTYKSNLIILPQANIGVNIINKTSLRFYVYGGVGITTFINNKKVNEYFNPANNTLYSSNEYELAPLALGLNLSSGVTIKSRFQILISYNFPTEIDKVPTSVANQSSLQAGIGYRFGKH